MILLDIRTNNCNEQTQDLSKKKTTTKEWYKMLLYERNSIRTKQIE
jgi:hypothetical protein